MIRPLVDDDVTALTELLSRLELFGPEELALLDELIAAFLGGKAASGETWLVDDDEGIVGVAYCAPERMTSGTWNLYLLAVSRERRREGRAAALIRYVETELKDRGERLLIVETSADPAIAPAWSLYQKVGFTEEARLRDFYNAGVDKLIFTKPLTGECHSS